MFGRYAFIQQFALQIAHDFGEACAHKAQAITVIFFPLDQENIAQIRFVTCVALFVPSDLIEIGLERSFCDAQEEV